jgi:putative cardiolipin synthase
MKSLILFIILVSSCTTLHHKKRAESIHHIVQEDTKLHKRYESLLKSHPEQSGIVPLTSGEEAIISRIVSIRDAEKTLDLQYYIWKDDLAGKLLLKYIAKAADRGVHVRLLLDNFYESRFVTKLKIVDQHSNIEVRMIDTNFRFLNHRMHNKALIADNQVAIIGGRNVGDEYFEVSEEANFRDFDVQLIGPVVEEVSKEFDQFWNCQRSFPITEIDRNPIEPRDLKKVTENSKAFEKEFPKSQYAKEFKESGFAEKYSDAKELHPYWGSAHIVYDPPAKLVGKNQENITMKLRPGLIETERELILISPYFIPGKRGMKTLKELRRRNVRIIILTNSLLSTDAMPVYSGYRKYREDLLKLGVEIYEFRSLSSPKKKSHFSSSGSIGLHGKVVIADRQKMFVGSMNLDPRSKNTNSEMGVVLNNTNIAKDSAEQFIKNLPEAAYRVELYKKKLRWIERTKSGDKIHYKEPGVTLWKNIKSGFSSLVMPEDLL